MAAMICMVVNNSAGGKAKMKDFLTHWEEPPASVQDVFKMLSSKAKKRK